MQRVPYITLAIIALSVGLASACSDRAASADSGAVWPDLGSTPDLKPDSAPVPDTAPPPDTQPPPDKAPPPDTMGPPKWKAELSAPVDLHAVACFKGHVFAVGKKGTILYRAKGKKTFVNQSASTKKELFTVAFGENAKGATYGVVAGKDYNIWQTMDLGTKWGVAPQCSAYIFDTFYALHLHDYDRGLGAGVAVNKQGGGSKYYDGSVSYSWVCATPTYKSEEFYDIFSFNKLGWMVGKTGGKVYYTSDGGVTWASVKTAFKYALRGLDFVGPSLGVTVGEFGGILRSTDGKGKVWKAITSPTKNHLWDVYMYSSKLGWAVGDKGTILHTTDGGGSWKVQPSGTTKRLESVCFSSASEGWAVGEGGVMLHTTTGGK